MTTQSTDELVKRLFEAQVGGCECLTKTPEIQYHDRLCKFRLCSESLGTIERLQSEVKAMREGAEQLKFLCSRMFAVELSPDGQHKWIFRNKPLVGENVQAAIDAARSEGEKP